MVVFSGCCCAAEAVWYVYTGQSPCSGGKSLRYVGRVNSCSLKNAAINFRIAPTEEF